MSFIFIILLIVCITGCSTKQNDEINVYGYYSGEQRENTNSDVIYLWNRGNIPKVTNYTENNGNYFDNPDFEPYMTVYDVPKGTKVKGAILVSPSGAFMFRSENTEGREAAESFAKLGYLSFVVHYGRLFVADLEESTFKDFNLPPTYYVYGTEDPFYTQFNAQVDLLNQLGKNVDSKILNKYPHGFGVRGEWPLLIDDWFQDLFN